MLSKCAGYCGWISLVFLSLPLENGGTPKVYAYSNQGRVQSFASAKKILKSFRPPGLASFYCDCLIQGELADARTCQVGDNFSLCGRYQSLDAEHIVPASLLKAKIRQLIEPVYIEGCLNDGRTCAQKSLAMFREIEGDLHNLRPALKKVNALRSNKKMALIKDAPMRGGCGFRFKDDLFEPPNNKKGDVARVYLYMNLKYPELKLLTSEEIKMFSIWAEKDTSSVFEKAFNEWVYSVQGDRNPFVDGTTIEK